MKKIFFALLLFSAFMFSCTQPNVVYVPVQQQPGMVQQAYAQPAYQNGYDVYYDNSGQQMVRAMVNGAEIYMMYSMWNNLYSNGGYNNIYRTYRSNPSRYYNTTIVNNYNTNHKTVKSYSIGKDNKPVEAKASVWDMKAKQSSNGTSQSAGAKNVWSQTAKPQQQTTQQQQKSIWKQSSSTGYKPATNSYKPASSTKSVWSSSKKR